jgi:hypothetical protein
MIEAMCNDLGMCQMYYMQSSSARDRELELDSAPAQAADGSLMPEVKGAMDGRIERFLDVLQI